MFSAPRLPLLLIRRILPLTSVYITTRLKGKQPIYRNPGFLRLLVKNVFQAIWNVKRFLLPDQTNDVKFEAIPLSPYKISETSDC